ncbi:AGAP004015-PA-like protein [Anopheles sinensis]|uniref:AGAP004015-PA-like protein n=1 Tax=Anopheles sinensis TaxID=74873 RepID=A0A084WNY7_ANOSI|nr:AGAP004015-PA-like protein [Anopheles sinensis]
MLLSKAFVLVSALCALAAVSGSPADVRAPGVKSTRMLQELQRHFVRPVVPVDFVPKEDNITGGRFRTRVDHFDPQNRDTFEFSYFRTMSNFAMTTYYITHGLLYDTAARDHAWLFTNEHRYYGTSTPVSDYSTENLRFLKSEQALVDLIEWIDHLRNNVVMDPQAKVILVGVGYGGALATWARQRFPNIIDGAWGAGATVLASFDFQEYAADHNT